MGITVLSPQHSHDLPTHPPLVDIVAIHGLFEGSIETWTDAKTGVLWLRDLFPQQQFNARILAYDYKAQNLASPGKATTDRILPYATSLVAELCAARELSNTSDCPIIFICHGFGGVLLKRALVISSTSRSKKVEHLRSIYISTYATIFLGTPHYGMKKEAILQLGKTHGAGPSQLELNLLENSEMLRDINDQFAPLLKRFSTYYFWEEMPTHAGRFTGYIVEEDSAAPVWDIADRCGIAATHSGLAKFRNSGDPGYQVILGALVRCIKAAPNVVKLRWVNDQQLLLEERRAEAEMLLQSQLPTPVPVLSNSSDVNELYLVPRCSTNYFTGRKEYTEILTETFNPTRQDTKVQEHKVFVIYGLGGSGKTHFCLRFIEDNRSRYWGVFWIDASSEDTAESGFADLGQQAGKGPTFAAGRNWLSNCSKPWLLVIDNADDPDIDISRYIPTGRRGHILITSRNPEAVIHATAGHFHFQGMDPDEAITLLLKAAQGHNQPVTTTIENKSLAERIASELGYLALALTLAGTTIRRNIYTLDKYLHYYLGYRRELISDPNIRNADDANVITTWEIPFRRIASRETMDYQDAVAVMHIFAFMHFESIPENIFLRFWNAMNGTQSLPASYPDILHSRSGWNDEAHARVRRAFRVLCDYSIIDHDPVKGFCSLHPVVHAWARGRLTLPEQKRWLFCTTAVLAHCISSNLEASGREFRRLLLPHIGSALRGLQALLPSFPETTEHAAELERFASVYAENSHWKLARTLQRKVVDLREKKLGKRHEATLQAQRSLGYICWNLFDVRSAIEIQVHVLELEWWSRPSLASWIMWPPWKPDHISYCIALSDLTMTLWLAGKRDISKRAGEAAVKGLSKHFGSDDPVTLSAMFNLARTCLHLREDAKSRELLVDVVKKRKRFFGPDHPDTLMARNELGMCYRALGRLDVAERLVYNVLQSRRRILGDEHAYTLWSVNDLAKVLCDRGRAVEAASMLEEIIPIVKRNLGEDHIGLVMTRSNLARAYALSQRWSNAEELFRKILDAITSDHPDWILAMSGYVHVRAKLGRKEETEQDCIRMLDVVTEAKTFDLDDPRIRAIAELLYEIYRSQGRVKEALALKNRIPGIIERMDAHESLFTRIYGSDTVHRNRPRSVF